LGGDGNDTITFAAVGAVTPPFDGGDDFDIIDISGDYTGNAQNMFTNIERVQLTAVSTISVAQLSSDNTFELEFVAAGNKVLTIAAGANGATINVSNLAFEIKKAATNGANSLTGGVIIRSMATDDIDAGSGNDTITVGAGANDISCTMGDDVETISDFVSATDDYISDFATKKTTSAIASNPMNLGAGLAIDTTATDIQQVSGGNACGCLQRRQGARGTK
jgi:hypothetical protein